MEYSGRYICVGLNPCFDVTLTLRELDDDKVNRVVNERCEAAGVALNVARALRNLRVSAQVCGFAGADNMQHYMADVRREGIGASFIRIPGAIRENLTLLTEGKTIKINRAGPTVPAEAIAEMRGYLNTVALPGDTVIFGGAPAAGMKVEEYASLMELAGSLGLRVVIDTDVLKAEHLMRIKPWLIAPNIHELEYIVSRKLETEAERLEACRELIRGGVENVLLTLGSEGLLAVRVADHVRVHAKKVEVTNTVGAGDNALAGFICSLLEGQSLEDSAVFAARLAESVISRPM